MDIVDFEDEIEKVLFPNLWKKEPSVRYYLIKKACEFQNDFLTVEKFAEYHGLTEAQAREFITLAQSVRASNHPEA